jgi:transposase
MATRFVGLDVHHDTVVITAVDHQQKVILKPKAIRMDQLPDWVQHGLEPSDHVVLEATSNAWTIHDLLKPLVGKVVVTHAAEVKQIAHTMVKTDKRDALVLARLLAANLLPEVWVPPQPVRELRALVSHRRQLVEQQRAAKNRLRSLLARHQVSPPPGGIDKETTRAWWAQLSLPLSERLLAEQNLRLLTEVEAMLDEVDRELARLSVQPLWRPAMAFLIQLPGIGMRTGMILLSAIGDIQRFPSAKHLVGYSGLGARVYSSGQTYRTGGITKQGRRELRTTLVEVAWVAVRTHEYWAQQFHALAQRIGKAKAIVALARKLLVVIWHVLSKHEVDRHADEAAVARSLMRWGAYYGAATSLRLPRAVFVRQELVRLGLGESVTSIFFAGRQNRLPPAETCFPT